MEELKEKEVNRKMAKRKMAMISILMTVVIVLIVISILAIILSFRSTTDGNYIVPNSYSFSGNILSTTSIYSDITLVVEEKENAVYGVTLRNNELVSQIVLNENLDFSEIKDFGIILGDYNNDGDKDFAYIKNKVDNGYLYNIYSIDKSGNFVNDFTDTITASSNRVSVKLNKNSGVYVYTEPYFYYDNYKVLAEIGEHELKNRSDVSKKTISKDSKISVDEKYKVIPRKAVYTKGIPEYVDNVNKYLLNMGNKQCIEVDLDGDERDEYIISYVAEGKTQVALLDSSANLVANIFSVEGDKGIQDIVEVADIDNDGIMEIVCVKGKSLEIHKYDSGFYY